MSTCSPIYSKCNARMKIRIIVIQKIVQQFMAEQKKNAHIHSHTFLYQFSLITIFFLLFNVRNSQSQAESSHAICINLLMLFFVVADTSSFFLKFLSFVERLILLKLIENHFTFHIVRSSFSICFISSCRLSEYEYLSLCFFSVLLADFVNCARIYRCSLS